MLHLISIVKFILSSISNGWLFWSVNHTSVSLYSELNVFKNTWFAGEISNKLPILLNRFDYVVVYLFFICFDWYKE